MAKTLRLKRNWLRKKVLVPAGPVLVEELLPFEQALMAVHVARNEKLAPLRSEATRIMLENAEAVHKAETFLDSLWKND